MIEKGYSDGADHEHNLFNVGESLGKEKRSSDTRTLSRGIFSSNSKGSCYEDAGRAAEQFD